MPKSTIINNAEACTHPLCRNNESPHPRTRALFPLFLSVSPHKLSLSLSVPLRVPSSGTYSNCHRRSERTCETNDTGVFLLFLGYCILFWGEGPCVRAGLTRLHEPATASPGLLKYEWSITCLADLNDYAHYLVVYTRTPKQSQRVPSLRLGIFSTIARSQTSSFRVYVSTAARTRKKRKTAPRRCRS